MSRASTWGTPLSVQDTVSLAQGDTVWMALLLFHAEVTRDQGRFDLVAPKRVRNTAETK